MRSNLWTFKAGFIVGAGIIAVGIVLQCCLGFLNWGIFRFPTNVVALAALCLLILSLFIIRKRAYAVRFLMSRYAAVPCLVYSTLLTALMGLVRQDTGTAALPDILGISRMLSCWPFVLVYLWMTLIVGLMTLQGVRHHHSLRNFTALLCHLGLFVALTSATLGSADIQRVRMICTVGRPEWRRHNQ